MKEIYESAWAGNEDVAFIIFPAAYDDEGDAHPLFPPLACFTTRELFEEWQSETEMVETEYMVIRTHKNEGPLSTTSAFFSLPPDAQLVDSQLLDEATSAFSAVDKFREENA